MTQPMPEAPAALAPWWHPTEFEEGECRHYTIGTLTIVAQRHADRWLLASRQLQNVTDNFQVALEVLDDMPGNIRPTRYVFRQAPRVLRMTPRSLDRPVVVKTDQPVQVPPGESITFFISAPVYVNVELPEQNIALQEIATLRLSDTWFGPSTQTGSLCYAARTHARNSRDEVPLRPHRAVTPVTINNQADTSLAIRKLSIPVPFLAVYGADDGTLWTDPVALTRTAGNPLINFAIGTEPPIGQLITAARTPVSKGGLIRAFTSIFAVS